MTINASRVRQMIDADASVTLKASGTVTATTTETAISLKELATAWWHDGTEIPHGTFEVGINVSALDKTTGDETYVVSLQVDDVLAQNDSRVTIATYTIPATGYYRMLVDSKSLPKLNTDNSGLAQFLAVKATLAGTTPSITYDVRIGRSLGA